MSAHELKQLIMSFVKRFCFGCIGKDLMESKPVFPDAEEEELATLYEIRVKNESNVNQILEELQKREDVEYAHLPVERKPGCS